MRYAAIAAAATTAALLGCVRIEFVTGTNFITGTYAAALFLVTPAGQSQINVLAAGGSLTIVIDAAGNTTGALHVPASVNGGTTLNESMAGTADIGGLTVSFNQNADTFVRDLIWSRIQISLSVTDQTVGGATYTITLNRLQTD